MRTLTVSLISAAVFAGPWSASVSQAAALTDIGRIAPGHYGYVAREGTPPALTEVKWLPSGPGRSFKDLNQINLNQIRLVPNQPADAFNASAEVKNKRSELIAR